MQILDYNTYFLVRMERDHFFNRNLKAIKDLPEDGRRWWKDKNAWWVTGTLRDKVTELQFTHRAQLINPNTASAGVKSELFSHWKICCGVQHK